MQITLEDFKKDYLNMSYESLAEKYKVSRSTVANLVREHHLSKKRGRKPKIRLV